MRSLLVSYLTATATLVGTAGALQPIGSDETVPRWHVLTLEMTGPLLDARGTPNPFRDVRLDVEFRHGARRLIVPGYFAADGAAAETGASGGDRWQVRFSPDEEGEWSFRVSFRTGPDVALAPTGEAGAPLPGDGVTGRFRVGPTTAVGRDFRAKGVLRRDGHYLRFQNGERFLKGGTNSPENFLGYEGFEGAAPGSKSYEPHVADWRPGDPLWRERHGRGIAGALNYLADQGMNSVFFLTNQVHVDGPRLVWPWISPDPMHWDRYDVAKLAQWDLIFEHMTRRGVVLHLVLGERENDFLLDEGTLGPMRRLYYRELVARFAHHPSLIWNLGEEFFAIAADYTRERETRFGRFAIPRLTREEVAERAREFSSHLRDLDPYDHPIVVHAQPRQKDDLFEDLLGHSAIDGPSLQHADRHEIRRWLLASRAVGHPWFVCLDESDHADPLPPQPVLGGGAVGVAPDPSHPWHDGPRTVDLWGTLMAGGAGVEWYFGYQYPHNDTSAQDWRTRHNLWRFTRHALEFFATLPLERMRAADGLARGGAYVLAAAGECYVVYFPEGGATILDLHRGHGRLTVDWFNPRDGSWQPAGTVEGGGLVRLQCPAEESRVDGPERLDWAVVLRAAPPRPLGKVTGWPTAEQRARLAELVRTDAEVGALFRRVREQADAALDVDPQPLERIVYEGRLPTEPARIETTRRLADMGRVQRLLEAWLVTGEERYAAAGRRFIVAWASTYRPDGNPINEKELDPALTAAVVWRDAFPPGERAVVKKWIRAIAEAGRARLAARPWNTEGNWHPKHLKLRAIAAHFTDDDAALAEVRAELLAYLDRSIRFDGTTHDFEERDSLSYHGGGVKPALRVAALVPGGAEIFHRRNPAGGSLAAAVEFVRPYARGEKVHGEFARTRAEIDRRRAAAGLQYYEPGRPWPAQRATELFVLASAFAPEPWADEARHASGRPGRFPNWQAVLAHVGWVRERAAGLEE